MANYITITQKRSNAPHKNVCSSAYVKMNIPDLAYKEQEAKKREMEEMAALAAKNLPGNVETSIVIREGSVIVEIICSGHLHELLSMDSLKAIGMSVKEGDIIDGLLTYAAIRTALGILFKDIKAVAATLSMYTRWVFQATKKQIMAAEARGGITGNFLRLLDAIDTARTKNISINVRADAMKTVLFHIKKIEATTTNAEERELLKQYLFRELKRVHSVSKEPANTKEKKDIEIYNDSLDEIRGIVEKF